MKVKKVQLIQVFYIITLILTAGCNSPHSNGNQKQDEKQTVAIDTTSTSPADSVNPEWNSKLDSMLRVAATAPQDTNLAKLYYDIGEMYFDNEPQKAKEYFLKLDTLSKKLNWNRGRYLYAAGYSNILNTEGLMDSSIVIHQQALELAKSDMNEKWRAIILVNLGTAYNYKQWFETALKYYNDALPVLEKQGDKFKIAYLYDMMGTVYYRMNMMDENLLYCEKSLLIFNEKPDTLPRVQVLINYAAALLKKHEFSKSENYLLEAQRICKLHNNRYFLYLIYNNLGEVALQKYDLDKMEEYNRKAINIGLEFGDIEVFCNSTLRLGYVEKYRGNFNQSEKYAMEALSIANEYDMPVEKKECYILLSDLSIALHDFQNNIFFKAKADSIDEVVVSEKTQRVAKEMEVKYETEKKELKITALEKDKRLMRGLSIAGGTTLLLTIATFILLWRWMVQKKRVAEQQQQLAEQQVKQLEQEKQLVATQAVLDGETRERARLARDLHDGLGSMLTGVKLKLVEMKKGVTLDYPDVERFDNALGLLDNSVQEMRRVAHHLMPDSLSRFGLKPAVSDFCTNLPSVRFTYYGDESRLEPKLEVMIYRSIHELVNNALKYAGASQILVQIIQEPDRIAFTVQDDGCGFDPAAESKGMGLQNIRTRVASYNGILDINSRPGEGTEVNVEIKN